MDQPCTIFVEGLRQVSFCPGEGWLAARFIFNDLDDMVCALHHALYIGAAPGRRIGPAVSFSAPRTRPAGSGQVSYLNEPPEVVEKMKAEMATHPHFDSSREVHEFKGCVKGI